MATLLTEDQRVTSAFVADPAVLEKTRRENLAVLVREWYGVGKLATQVGVSIGQMSAWLRGNLNYKTGKRRGISFQSCRRIELACGKAAGWLDTPHNADSDLTLANAYYMPLVGEIVTIGQFDESVSQRSPMTMRGQRRGVLTWTVTRDWLEGILRGLGTISNLRIVTGFGDAMRPIFDAGDPLLIDTGTTSVEADGLYFFRVDDEAFVRRLQRVPGQGLLVLSENTAYRDWTIDDGMDLQVFGRLVMVFRGNPI